MNNVFKIVIPGLMLVLSTASYASEQPVSAYNELENSSYRLAERVATDGTSALIMPEVYTKQGIWTEDRFIFPGAQEDSEVLVSWDKIDDKPIKIIQLQVNKDLTRTLQFSQIRAEPRLVLQFKVPPSSTSGELVSSVYIRIYIGNRLLDRLRLSADEVWIQKEYALSNAQFLKKKLSLTLSISGDSDKSILMLYGYLKN